ncbi:MAG: hypothetical protein ACTSUR_00380 [Candidatus Heimdallarchaeaceae archaeon]
MTASLEDRMCRLTCRSFSCSKRMLKVINNNGKKSFICKMDDSECLGYMCNYAECRERKMSDSGKCLRPVKIERTNTKKAKSYDRYAKYEYLTPNDLDDKFRKKLAKKFK